MRVLHVIGQLVPGGSEKVTLQVASEFRRRGEEHEVAAFREIDSAFVRAVAIDDLPIHGLSVGRDNLVFAARGLAALVALVRRIRPQVIQGHAFRSSVAAGLVGHATGVPVVATLHRLYYPKLETLLDRFLQRLWERVIVDSNAVAELLATRAGIDSARFAVVPNFVSPQFLLEGARHAGAAAERGGPLRILMAAHFTEVKGHRFLIDALALLEERAPGRFEVDLVGEGPLLTTTKEVARRRGVDDIVSFHGRRSDLARWLAAADVVVLPSLWEGFGLILAEAGAFGRPAISFRVGGAEEVIIHEETGLLVPPGDIGALADALDRLETDRSLAVRLGLAGRARVLREYTVDRVLADYSAVYEVLA